MKYAPAQSWSVYTCFRDLQLSEVDGLTLPEIIEHNEGILRLARDGENDESDPSSSCCKLQMLQIP